MTSSTAPAFTAPRDPTEVVGRRLGASVIDQIFGFLLIPLVLVIGSYNFYERVPAPSNATAVEACNAYNDAVGPNGAGQDTLCIPWASSTLYVDIAAVQSEFYKLYAALLVLGLLNPVLLQGLTGASLGKHAFSLRVVKEDGRVAPFGSHIIRYLLLMIEGGIIGLILLCVTRGHRRLGDMAAGTYVIGKGDVGSPVQVPNKPGTPFVPTAYAGGQGAPVDVDGPHWDAQRNTYIRFDRTQSAWLQWNDTGQQWGPIDT